MAYALDSGAMVVARLRYAAVLRARRNPIRHVSCAAARRGFDEVVYT